MRTVHRPSTTAGWLLVTWAALLTATLFSGLASYPLFDPDEGRNAEVAREMAAGNDYLVPRLDGLPYLDKPVLFFSLEAAAIEVLGADELAVRLPPALFALATALLVGWFAGRLLGGDGAVIAGLATLVSPLSLAFARTVIFDSLLALWVTAALVAFYFAIAAVDRRPSLAAGRDPAMPSPWLASALAWGAMGLGVLTKGPVALLLPLLVAVPYALWRRAGRVIWYPGGPLLLTLLVAPWVWAVSRQVPEFLHYALWTETWQRLTTGELQRTGPLWYYLPYLFGGMLPWSVVALAACARRRAWRGPDGRPDPVVVFAGLWLLLPLVFFSLSQSKRPQYLLPLVPAVALLVARCWHDAPPGRPLPGARAAALAWLALGAALLAAPVILAARPPAASPPLLAAIEHTAVAVGVLAVASALVAWRFARRRAWVLIVLGLPAAALPVVARPLLAEAAATRSARDLAAVIATRLPPDGRVVGVAAFPPSLPFYLRRQIILSSASGAELTSNYLRRSYDRWVADEGSPLRSAAWWRRALNACSPPAVFVVERRHRELVAALAAELPTLASDERYLAFGPCTPPER